MTDNIIYLKDLDCYINASTKYKEHKLYFPNRYFDLTVFAEKKISNELEEFIRERGTRLTPLSIKSDLYPFNLLCKFLPDAFPELNSLKDVPETELIKEARVWLGRNGKHIKQSRIKTTTGKIETYDSELITYIKKIYSFLNPTNTQFNKENDIWYFENFPLPVKQNLTKRVKSLSFKKIPQTQIRQEVKEAIFGQLVENVSLGTILAEKAAVNRFTKFLNERYPEVETLNHINRELIEQYLIHTNTEATGRKSYSKELYHLKSLLIAVGKFLENPELENIFFEDDIGKVPYKQYKVYSESEEIRLNAAIVKGDKQIARALFIQQLLGTRISETLTLRHDSIFKGEDNRYYIRIYQVKTRKSCVKPVNDDIKHLFDDSVSYTKEKFGNREYVFVNETNPDLPMSYSRIQYHIMTMVNKYDLRDDHGRRFSVGTHIWRHCYGKRLTELHVDDHTIAELMGHANTSNLKYYRKIGNKMLADETRPARLELDAMLKMYLG